MSEPTLDERVAERLSMNPQQVAMLRDEWEKSPKAGVVRTAYHIRLQDAIDEAMRKLRGCSVDDLKGLQESIKALELAQTIVGSRLGG